MLQVKNNLLLNNQMCEDKLTSSGQQPLKKIVNNLANDNNNISCNKCKESQISSKSSSPLSECVNNNCSNNNNNNINNNNNNSLSTTSSKPKKSSPKGGIVNLAFVDAACEQSSWYQPHLPRELAVKILAEGPVGSFIVRNSQSQMSSGCLALTVRVPRSFNGTGILHYLILATEAGFRIKGFSKVFSSLSGLVVHHSVMRESLPCRLIIHTREEEGDTDTEERDKEGDFADLDADPEYPGILSRLREQLKSE